MYFIEEEGSKVCVNISDQFPIPLVGDVRTGSIEIGMPTAGVIEDFYRSATYEELFSLYPDLIKEFHKVTQECRGLFGPLEELPDHLGFAEIAAALQEKRSEHVVPKP